jgi:TRAP-type C4-dicarboxylate transport system substrate-binding protein
MRFGDQIVTMLSTILTTHAVADPVALVAYKKDPPTRAIRESVHPMVKLDLRGMGYALLAIATLLLSAAPASAEGPAIVIRFADDIPKTHPISVYGTKFWMDRVTEKTYGRVTFEWYPAGQLGHGRDLLTLVQSGAVDMASTGPSYTPDKLPLSAVAELPAMFPDICAGSRAMWTMTKFGGGGLLDQREYTPLGLHVVFAFTNPPYEIQTVKQPVASPLDVKGLKFKTLGGASDDAARLLGAVPVQMSVADLFLGLQRGTVDGRFGAFNSVFANSTQDVLHYSTVGVGIGSFGLTTLVGDRRWKSLPPDVQQAMLEAGDATWKNWCEKAGAETKTLGERLVKDHHWVNHVLTPDETAAWRTALAPIPDQWAKEQDQRGKPGRAILDAFRAAAH